MFELATIFKTITILIAVISAGVSVWAVWIIAVSDRFSYKPLWIIGSLVGFAGVSINWMVADDIYLTLGVIFPVVNIYAVIPIGAIIVKAGFPFIATAALHRHYVTFRSPLQPPR